MQLHCREWGAGNRVAVLVHGLMGESRQFHRLGPMLAARGYRTIAVDLPGHGLSPPSPTASILDFADDLVTSIPNPTLLVGHDLGAAVVSLALARLHPKRCVYVDADIAADPPLGAGVDLRELEGALTEELTMAKLGRTVANLRQSRPAWTNEDRIVEAEAARRFDVQTAVSIIVKGSTETAPPAPTTEIPSLVVLAERSTAVLPERARELLELGYTVRSVPRADHIVWHRPHAFLKALKGWV
jgi:pimeloyl-ACP methyl ester carboxylesterase